MMKTAKLILTALLLVASSAAAQASERPNIVLILMDNFGWGELGTYGGGILRGAATPRIDSLADDGMKLLNFNVEAQCTPSRAALLTGRHPIRSGNGTVPLSTGVYGLTQWEYTLAEMLSDTGYRTAMYGKWHLGDSAGRYPTDQGFDEWFGIPNSTDESFWPDSDLFREGVHPLARYEHVLESRRGEEPEDAGVYDSARRLIIDREITEHAVEYIQRASDEGKPFFLYLPYTQTHMPVEPAPEWKGRTGNGRWADVLAQTDHYVGQVLDAVDEAGIRDNTIFIFTSDNGPEALSPHQGFGGPWRGSYFTGLEGSLRVPFLVRWPEHIPAGSVSNEIVHLTDLYTTLAGFAGGDVPTDRVLDSVDQGPFFLGDQEGSNRESVIIYVGNEIYGVKWRNWKLVSKELGVGFGAAVDEFPVGLVYNLHADPKEEFPMRESERSFWVRYPAGQALMAHMASFRQEPPIRPGTPDPYEPQ